MTITHPATNRYANDWNGYSARWNEQFGSRHQHLGDEWWDQGTLDRVFALVERFLTPSAQVLEIGPGGGKWTVRLAPRVARVIAFDVADEMLIRTRARCERDAINNVRYLLSDGSGSLEVDDESIDIVFSYDVFVHITLEDTVHYVGEMGRVLRPGGVAIIHHAVNEATPAWDRIESINDWYRRGATLGQFYYHSVATLQRMYERAGLVVRHTSTEHGTAIMTVQKPEEAVGARLEMALRRAAVARNEPALDHSAREIAAIAADTRRRLENLLDELIRTPQDKPRYAVIQKIRRLLRP